MTVQMWKVFSYEFRRNIRRTGFLFTAFVIPLIGAALFGLIQTFAAQESEEAVERFVEERTESGFDVGLVDLSGLFAGLDDLPQYASEEEAQAALDGGELDAFYVVGQDYAETGDVLFVLPRFTVDALDNETFERYLTNTLTEEAEPQIANRLQNPSIIEAFEFSRTPEATGDGSNDSEGEAAGDGQAEFWLVYAFALIFMFALFGTNGYLMQSVIEEKETRVIEVLMSSIRPLPLLAGKILAFGALGIFQVVAWVGTVLVLGQIAGNAETLSSSVAFLAEVQVDAGTLVIMLLYFVLGYLFFAAVFGGVGAISISMSEGPNYATIFTLPLIAPFLVITVFTETPNGAIPVFLSLFPLTAPISMLMRLAVTDVPLIEIALSLGLLAVTDVAMIWLASRLFRAQSLLSGQVPKIRELPGLLRG